MIDNYNFLCLRCRVKTTRIHWTHLFCLLSFPFQWPIGTCNIKIWVNRLIESSNHQLSILLIPQRQAKTIHSDANLRQNAAPFCLNPSASTLNHLLPYQIRIMPRVMVHWLIQDQTVIWHFFRIDYKNGKIFSKQCSGMSRWSIMI